MQPGHSLPSLDSQKVVIIVTPCQCLLFSPALLSSQRNYLPTSPLLSAPPLIASPISRPLPNNGQWARCLLYLFAICLLFRNLAFHRYILASFTLTCEVGEGALEGLNMPPECPVPSIIYHLTICRRPSPSPPPPHVPIKYGLSKHFMPIRFLSPGEGSFCFQRNAGRRRLINVEINEGILHPATICKYRVKFMLSTFINLGSDMSKY